MFASQMQETSQSHLSTNEAGLQLFSQQQKVLEQRIYNVNVVTIASISVYTVVVFTSFYY